MWNQFILANVHFALNLFAGLVFFAIAWLYFDARLTSKTGRGFLKIMGVLLLSLSFIIHSTFIESSILETSLSGGPLLELETIFRLLGFLLIFVAEVTESFPKKPEVAPVNGVVPLLAPIAYVSFFKPILTIMLVFAYWRKVAVGLEAHLRPLVIGFGLLAISELLSLSSFLRGSENLEIYKLTSPFGPLWILEHMFLLVGIVILGKWIFGYLLKQFRTQLFMFFVTTIVSIFLLVTVVFSGLLVKNIQDENLKQLGIDAKVLEYTLEGKKLESLSGSTLFAQNSGISNAIKEGTRTFLASTLEEFLVSENYSFAVITDKNAQVLARGEDSEKIGDSLSSDTLVQKSISGNAGVDFDSRTGALTTDISIRAAAPIKNGEEVIGVLMVGTQVDNSYVDGIKKATGLEASIYGGIQVSATTILGSDGKSRLVGIREESQKVKEDVLSKGSTYSGSVKVAGVSYLGSYLPIKNIDGNPVGMIFIGKPQIAVFQAAGRSIEITFLTTAVL